MSEKNTSIIKDYLNYHETYIKKYGSEKTLVLMQVGSFYESYATTIRGPKLSEIANILNIICTRRDKTVPTIDEKNPYMMGFNLISSQKFINILINNGFTLIMIDQVTPPPNPERKVTNIISPSTYIENLQSQDTNYSVCLYFEEELQKNSANLLCAGMAAVDLSTGKCFVHEAQSKSCDQKLAIDESIRFINTLNPSELIIYYTEKTNGMPTEKLITLLEISDRQYFIKNLIDKKYFKPLFQNVFLSKIYQNTGLLSPIEYLDLDRLNYARISLMMLLEFAYEHNANITKDISKPEQYMDNTFLTLANNAIYQLNIVESNLFGENVNSRFKCLFDVVNNTSTSQGRRFLKDRLVSPLVCPIELEKIYSHNEELLEDNIYDEIEKHLKGISDIERLERKISLHFLGPHELFILTESCEEIIIIYNMLVKHNKLTGILPSKDVANKLNSFITTIKNTFEIEELKKYGINNISNSFFKMGIHKDLDKLKQDIKSGHDFYNELCKQLSEYITDQTKKPKKDKILIKKTNSDKYYLSLTKVRAAVLKENLECVESLDVNGTVVLTKNFVYNDTHKNFVKITIQNMESDDNHENDEQISELTKKYYVKELTQLYTDYHDTFKIIISFISYVDYIKSNAKTAKIYNYKRPIIKNDNNNSYISCKQLRHPIIERIIDYEYVPHDLVIGKDMKGILLYGLNSSGKCFDPNTPLIMHSGEIKLAKNIRKGDLLMGDDSTPRKVLGTTRGFGKMYEIQPDEYEDSFRVNGPHILCLKDSDNNIIEISVDEYLQKSSEFKSKYVLYYTEIDFPHCDVSDPYNYGKSLYENSKINQSNIHNSYKFNSRQVRIELFNGIIGNSNDIIINDETFLKDFIYLCRSLGFITHKCVLYNEETNNHSYYVEISENDTSKFKIIDISNDEYCGFETDGNKRFLLSSFIVTHNSSLMKSIGLGIILAQAGMYVPSQNFTYYPFKSLFTRITGMDNIFKGLSSFAVEMMELKAILKRSDKNSLIIGDEVCRGTEHISGNSLVAATVINLADAGAIFLFATHLHEIANMERIKKIQSVKSFHISVDYDKKTDSLVYDRQLKEGPGEPVYGITFAKYVIQDIKFIETAMEIKNELMKTYNEFLTGKKSKYNNDVLVHECQVCGKSDEKLHVSPLETHHIKYQKDCADGFSNEKPHIAKNSKANLIVLCNVCHDKIHNNELIIDGYVMTSHGKSIVINQNNETMIINKNKKNINNKNSELIDSENDESKDINSDKTMIKVQKKSKRLIKESKGLSIA